METAPAPRDGSRSDPPECLDSWKEIAAYLNRGVRTVIRWEQEEGLPVHRLQHDKRGSVYAYKSELDEWQRTRSAMPEEPADSEVAPLPPAPVPSATAAPAMAVRHWPLVAVALLVLAVVAAATVWIFRRSADTPPRISRLTSFNGMEITPALSPDGRLVAFSWNGPNEDNQDIYVQLIGSGSPLRLTTDPARDSSPAWAPDGKYLAFVRLNPDLTLGIYKVPALGGPEQRIGTVRRPANTFPLRLNWTPDGRWVLASHTDEWTGVLFLIPCEGGEMRQLTAPAPGLRDLSGAISPDGRKLAFLRSADANSWRIHVADLGPDYRVAGEPVPIGPLRYSMLAPIWSSDSRNLYYVKEDNGVLAMYSSRSSGDANPRLISAGWPTGWTEASLLPDQGRAVLSDGWTDLDMWRFDLTGAKAPARFASSTSSDINPQYSPDGRRVAYSSRRSGLFQIWLAGADGSNERQLTKLVSTLTGMPRWSPDGKTIAFDARVEGREGIWVVDAEAGEPRCLTPVFRGVNPSWSRDGKFVYFSSRQSGRAEIWRIPVSSGRPAGDPIQITTTEGWSAFQSWDGRFLYYAQKYQNGPILRIPVGGGDAAVVVPRINVLHNFAIAENGLYYGFAETPQSNESVWLHSFATGQASRVVDAGRRSGIGLTVAPDGRTLICTLTEFRGGDLWLVDGFRK